MKAASLEVPKSEKEALIYLLEFLARRKACPAALANYDASCLFVPLCGLYAGKAYCF